METICYGILYRFIEFEIDITLVYGVIYEINWLMMTLFHCQMQRAIKRNLSTSDMVNSQLQFRIIIVKLFT